MTRKKASVSSHIGKSHGAQLTISKCRRVEELMRAGVGNKRGINEQHVFKRLHNPSPKPLYTVCILGENIRRLSHVATVLNGLCRAWRSILLMESKPLSQIQMRCTQLWLVLEKHLSEQRLTEGFLNTRQSQCLTQRRGERCAQTA